MNKTLLKITMTSALTVATASSTFVTAFAEEGDSIDTVKQNLEAAKAALEQAKNDVACKFRFSGTLISLSPEHLLRENGTPNSEKWNACFFYFKMV